MDLPFEEQIVRCAECCICSDLQTSYRTLVDCGHSICDGCLMNLITYGNDHKITTNISCPYCLKTYSKRKLLLRQNIILPQAHTQETLSNIILNIKNPCEKHRLRTKDVYCCCSEDPHCIDCFKLDHRGKDHYLVDFPTKKSKKTFKGNSI